jgi:hypothetical protein
MIPRRLQFLRHLTRNIDPAAQVTRLKLHLRETFCNATSRDEISMTVECDTLNYIAIILALANANCSRACSNGGLKIESGLLGRASSRQEMSPVLKRASLREIQAYEYPSDPSVPVSPFSNFRAPQRFSEK